MEALLVGLLIFSLAMNGLSLGLILRGRDDEHGEPLVIEPGDQVYIQTDEALTRQQFELLHAQIKAAESGSHVVLEGGLRVVAVKRRKAT